MDEAFYETPGCVFFLCVQRSKGKDVPYLEYWVVVMLGGNNRWFIYKHCTE
jgi:hypothetical protein